MNSWQRHDTNSVIDGMWTAALALAAHLWCCAQVVYG
jgi:hypothetical protein